MRSRPAISGPAAPKRLGRIEPFPPSHDLTAGRDRAYDASANGRHGAHSSLVSSAVAVSLRERASATARRKTVSDRPAVRLDLGVFSRLGPPAEIWVHRDHRIETRRDTDNAGPPLSAVQVGFARDVLTALAPGIGQVATSAASSPFALRRVALDGLPVRATPFEYDARCRSMPARTRRLHSAARLPPELFSYSTGSVR